MPRSDHRQYSPVMEAVLRRQPRSVLDIGVGLGTYGHLLRAHLGSDLYLRGYEPWTAYRHDGDWSPYDRVYPDAWPHPTTKRYDLALMVDVVEHYRTRTAATRALDALVGVARCIVMTVPKDALGGPHADATYDNPHEYHHWQPTISWAVYMAHWQATEVVTLPDSILIVLEAQ